MEPETELLLFAASRAQLVRQEILPALSAGRIVISDRFLDSTTVYQGVARNIPRRNPGSDQPTRRRTEGPDITFLLDMDSAEAYKRLIRRPAGNRDRMEEQPPAFYEAVRRGYLELAATQSNRIRLLDATKPEKEIAREIRAALRPHAIFKGIGV